MRTELDVGRVVLGACILGALAGASRAEGQAPGSGGAPTSGEVSAPATGPEHGKLATSDATPVGARALEIEAAYVPTWKLRGTGSFDPSARGSMHALDLTVTYGIAEDVDVAVSLGWATTYDAAWAKDPDAAPGPAHGHGLTDSSAGVRWRILSRPELGLDVAVRSGLVLPTGARGGKDRVALTESFWSFQNALIASKDLGAFTADAEVGWSLPLGRDRDDERGTLFANLAGGWQVLSWLQPELEVNYQRSFMAGSPASDLVALTGGVVAPFHERYRIAAGAQVAVWGRHTDQFVTGTLAFKAAF